jgi:hypothetical protein
MPVYIHNLKGYDSHFLVPSLNKYGYKHESSENITCIPCNEEKYISFSKIIKVDEYTSKKGIDGIIKFEIRFIDTLAFMASSLDSLTENLKKDCKTTQELRCAFKNLSEKFVNDDQLIMNDDSKRGLSI